MLHLPVLCKGTSSSALKSIVVSNGQLPCLGKKLLTWSRTNQKKKKKKTLLRMNFAFVSNGLCFEMWFRILKIKGWKLTFWKNIVKILFCAYLKLKTVRLVYLWYFWSCRHRTSLIRGGDRIVLGRQVPIAITNMLSAPWVFPEAAAAAQKPQR